MDPQEFLRTLWGDPPPGVINIWRLPDRKSSWHRDLGSINSFLQKFAHEEVYTGVSLADPQKGRFTTMNRIEEVAAGAIAGVWADIDVFHPVHTKAEHLPGSRDEAREVMRQLPHEPTIIVDSGHGLQYWWLFKSPWVFNDKEEWGEARRTVQWWHHMTKDLFKERGWTTDSVYDLSRILRIPGTFNNKVKDDPKEVVAVKSDGPRHTVEEFRKLVPEDFTATSPAPEQKRGRRRGKSYEASTTASGITLSPDAQPNLVRLQALLKADQKFQQSWDRKRPDMKDQSPSSYNMSLADIAVQAGWDDQEVVNLMICWRRIHNCDLKLRESYYMPTLARAKEAPPRAGRSSGNRKRKTPEDWMASWPAGLDPLVKRSTRWEGSCPACFQREGDGGSDRFHVNAEAPYHFGCRHCTDPKTGRPDMRPYYAVFGRPGGAKASKPTTPKDKDGGGVFFRIGEHIGQSLRPMWRYLDRAEGPTWARFQDGCWQEITTQDRSLIGFISANRFRIAGELEGAGWPEGAAALGNDRLWDHQKFVGSDLWDGLRQACRGQVPEPLPYHVGVKNGCVDLATGDLHSHRPGCGQRALTAGLYLPEDWERLSALLAAHLAPVFIPETQRDFLELIGLSLTDDAATYRGLVLILGMSRSGKGGVVRLQRRALGERSAAINADWFSRRALDIDAETANLLHRRPNSIATSELGAESLRHRKKVLASIGGEDELVARRPHGATVTGIITALWWSSCVDIPRFEVGDGMAERLAVLRTIGRLRPGVKKPERQTFTQDLMDAVITGAILAIRQTGFFDDSPAGYVAPGGPGDSVTAEGLAEMDPPADWLTHLPDSWDGRLVEEARAQAQDDLGEEISATRFGTHIEHSERWYKRRKQDNGVQGMRLYLAEGGCRVADPTEVFSDSPEDVPNKPSKDPATLQPEGSEEVDRANAGGSEMQSTVEDATGDLPYQGPDPRICTKHCQALIGEGCPACYREWSAAEADTVSSNEPPQEERCQNHIILMVDGMCERCEYEAELPDNDDSPDGEE